ADQSFVTGSPTAALTNAVQNHADVVQQVANRYPTAQITLTGVSEGGGISEIVGHFANVQTVTFIAPGSGQLLPSFVANQTLISLGSMAIPTPATQIINYRIYGDQLSLVGQSIGTQITVTPDTATGCGLLGACALQQVVDFAGPLLLQKPNLPILFTAIHNGHLLETALTHAPQTPGVLGAWNDNWVQWSYSAGLIGVDTSSQATVLAHFYKTTEPGPNYVPALLPILNGLVLAFDTLNFESAVASLFNHVVPAGVPVLVDPPAGYLYSLRENPGRPDLSSIVLPTVDVVGGNNVGWQLTYYTENGLSGMQTSYTGEFDLPPKVNAIDFYAIDSSGQAVPYNDSLLFSATFSSSGSFDATLTTYLTPVLNLPLTSGQSCNGTFNGNFVGDLTLFAGQNCGFVNDCEI